MCVCVVGSLMVGKHSLVEDDHALDLDTIEAREAGIPGPAVFDVLASAHARYVLYYLAVESTASLEELASVVAGLEAMLSDSLASVEDHRRAKMNLVHAVLPKLEELGCLEFDRDEDVIIRLEIPAMVREVLGLDADLSVDDASGSSEGT